jgi:hypothetical protein
MFCKLMLSGACLCLLFSGQITWAQDRRIIPFVKEDIDFDGIPNEEVWKTVDSFPFVMHQPNTGKIPEQKTDVRLLYDKSYLYLGASLYYNKPEMITATGKVRDYAYWDTDWIGISMDTYNDKENMMLFAVNPNGIRTDALTKNDMINGMSDINFSFNTFWDAKTKIIGNIWYSEIRIPLSSLRFQTNADKVVMGITILRAIANSGNPDYGLITFPEILQTKGDMLYWKASVGKEVEFKGLKSRKPLYFAPYILGGINRYYNENTSDPDNDYRLEPGLDVKYGLTNNLTLDVTANTDFAQVEADQEQFNLTRFSLFFPEKRLFFQEKYDVFDFSFDQYDNLFYSRNIGLYNGSPVRIYGGLRMTGRTGNWDLGVLDMQTAKFEDLPSENFGIIRTKRRVINEKSYIGGMFTSRVGNDGSQNMAYGADCRLLLFGDDYLTVKWAQTYETNAENKFWSMSPSQAYLSWERKRIKGFAYKFLADWSGKNYNPGVGLETRDNFMLKYAKILYGWLPGEKSKLNSHQISSENSVYNSSVDGSLESVMSKTGWAFTTNKITTGSIYLNWELEDLKDTYYIVDPDIFIPAGRYNFCSLTGEIYSALPNRSIEVDLTASAGSYYDGYNVSTYFQPRVKAGRSIIINGIYQMDWISFKNRDQQYTNNIFAIKGNFMFTTKLSLTTYIQYNTFSDKFIANARIRFNAKEGNDFYIVYNEGIDSSVKTNLHIDLPGENRTILLKYTYTFTF